jgi:hypothetical protein
MALFKLCLPPLVHIAEGFRKNGHVHNGTRHKAYLSALCVGSSLLKWPLKAGHSGAGS